MSGIIPPHDYYLRRFKRKLKINLSIAMLILIAGYFIKMRIIS